MPPDPYAPSEGVVDPKVGSTLDGKYRLDERLGAGGMGIVYRGIVIETAQPVAVKLLHESFATIPDLVKRFGREVEAMRRLSHPHLVGILESGMAGRVPYLVMEFLSGKPLGEVLDASGALHPTRAVNLAQQILSGVAHAHATGIVHRDLKPDNILMVGDFVKILDFGLAKMAQENATQLTTSGLALGTPSYMSPEQARGAVADHRADLYSIGVILYHMVVGKKPFVADSPMTVLRMHMDDAPVPPRKAVPAVGLSAALEAAILRALAKAPEDRFESADAFARALAATPEGGGSLDDEAFDATVMGHLRAGASAPPLATLAAEASAAVDEQKQADIAVPAISKSPAPRRRRARPSRSWMSLGVVVLLLGGSAFGWSRLPAKTRAKITSGGRELWASTKKLWDKSTTPEPTPSTASTPSMPSTSQPIAVANAPAPATPPPTAKAQPHSPPMDDPTLGGVDPPVAPPPVVPAVPPPTAVDDDDIDDRPAPDERDTPGQRLESTASTSTKVSTPAEAARLLEAGKTDEAIAQLYQLRKRTPRSGMIALLLGHAYFKKGWRPDGLREYKAAITYSPALKKSPILIHNTVQALDGSTYRAAHWLLRSKIGPSSLGELRRAAKSDPDTIVRRRAGKLVGSLSTTSHVRKKATGKRRRR